MQDSERILFKSFGSGSSGNCYYLAVERRGAIVGGILIDAGISLRRVKQALLAEHLTLSDFGAILVTHDHLDHIRSLGSFCKTLHTPVWATRELHSALAHHTFTLDHIAAVRHILEPSEWNEIIPGLIWARYFVVPHDATQTVGYDIRVSDYRFVLITDCGHLTPEALASAREAQTLVIESNYDDEMLSSGPYPLELQNRIRGGHGHTSNAECAQALLTTWHEGLSHIYLCHLSENNNTPERAYESAAGALSSMGYEPSYITSAAFIKGDRTITMMPLPRRTVSPLFTLESTTSALF